MKPFVVLLWIWLAVSLSVYAYRLFRWFMRRIGGTPTTTSGPDETMPPPGSSPPPGISPATPAPAAGASPMTYPLSTPDDHLTPTQRLFKNAAEQKRREAAGEASGPPGDPGGAPSRGSGQPVGRTGLFAPSAVSDAAVNRPSSKPVAELLRGIRMPCDLVPVIEPDATDTAWRVAFSTRGFDAAEVGSKVGDELERLGFALRSLNDAEVQATRGDDTLTVRLIINPEAARRDDRPAFPSLPPGSLVVEFSSR